MRWRKEQSTQSAARPKAAKLSKEQAEPLLKSVSRSLEKAPVLSELGHTATFSRGRFYIQQTTAPTGVIGRITPLCEPEQSFVLETGNSDSGWQFEKKGKIRSITNALSNDGAEMFYRLGDLDKSIKKHSGKNPVIVKTGAMDFHYQEPNQQPCSVQAVLYHFFQLPITVIAEPREWYAYHRRPQFMEISTDNTKVLVQFSASSMNGATFGGTCLYIKQNHLWTVYRIKPNQSSSIDSAIQWLEKREWRGW